MTRFALFIAAVLLTAPAAAERIYWNDALASELIGSPVVNRSGERLGEVRDLALDLKAEQVSAVLVESGGFLGLFEDVRAFPLSWLAPGKREDRVVLNIPATEAERVGERPAPHLPRASGLLGREVRDAEGVVAGELRDFLVNLGDGRLRHAVLVLKRPERQVTVAPRLLAARHDELVVQMSFAELQALVAP